MAFCTSCGTVLEANDRFCTSCGVSVPGPAPGPAAPAPPPGAAMAPPPPGYPGAYAPPAGTGGAMRTVVILVVLLVIVAVAAVAFISLTGGATGDCVYTFEGRTSRYPNYSESECDAYCSNVRYGSCWFDPYMVTPEGIR